MITREKLEIYERYKGDGDALIRVGTPQEKHALNYSDWKLIENLLQDIQLISNNQTSDTYADEVKQVLYQKCDSSDTVEKLKEIAKRY